MVFPESVMEALIECDAPHYVRFLSNINESREKIEDATEVSSLIERVI